MKSSAWLTFGMSKENTPGFQDTSRLMTYAMEGKVGYIEPPRPLAAWKEPHRRMFSWEVRQSAGRMVFAPPLPVPRKADPLRLALRIQASNLKHLLVREFGPNWRTETTFYITNWSYYQQPLLTLLRPKHLVFDVVDDVLAFPYGFPRNRLLEAWAWLARHAQLTLAVSPTLQRLTTEQLGVGAVCLPNGVDAEHFTQATGSVPEILQMPSDNLLRIGFAGTLNHWIHYDSMLEMMERHPNVRLFLMGRIGSFGSREQQASFERLKAHERVQWVGNVPYEELPNALHAMDILLLPRIRSAASESSSPLKLYEYLAVGKPIVISGVPLPDEIRSLVYAGDEHLSAALHEAERELTGDLANQCENRRAYAAQHTWRARVAAINDMLKAKAENR